MNQAIETTMATLAEHEAVIERGLTTFVEVGNALLAIRDGRLYREQFATFESYCQLRWGWERAHAYRLMNASEVAGRVSPMGDIPAPTAERQVRPLTQLPADEQPAAWREAVEESGGRVPTQATVERIVRQRIVDEEEPAYDAFVDEEVPVREVWEEADEEFAAELEEAAAEVPPPQPAPASRLAPRQETEDEREERARQEAIARESQRFARAISYTAQIISNDLARHRLAAEYDQEAAVNPFVVTREAIATAAENLRLLAEVWSR